MIVHRQRVWNTYLISLQEVSVTVAPSGTRRIALAVATSCDLSEARALWESWAYTTPGLNNTSERRAASRIDIERRGNRSLAGLLKRVSDAE